MLFIVLAMPRLGGKNHYWLNGLYEALCVIVVFPWIVALGAGGKLSGSLFSKGCDFMGKISYPLYIVHYPVIYLYWSWVTPRHLP
uniref:acyltransferase family protein n=1 Tax=Odoribacter splanchnicus TaxID=28118 RepID=UPI0011C3FD83|nr:acyltransferase family protein [Odoribacter splanchnicus]